MIGSVQKRPIFQLLSCCSHRSKRTAKSTPDAEILAGSEDVDELVMIKKVLSTVLKTEIKTMMVVDSKDLHHALSSNRNTVDKSVRPDVISMRFQFETAIDFFVWI